MINTVHMCYLSKSPIKPEYSLAECDIFKRNQIKPCSSKKF